MLYEGALFEAIECSTFQGFRPFPFLLRHPNSLRFKFQVGNSNKGMYSYDHWSKMDLIHIFISFRKTANRANKIWAHFKKIKKIKDVNKKKDKSYDPIQIF